MALLQVSHACKTGCLALWDNSVDRNVGNPFVNRRAEMRMRLEYNMHRQMEPKTQTKKHLHPLQGDWLRGARKGTQSIRELLSKATRARSAGGNDGSQKLGTAVSQGQPSHTAVPKMRLTVPGSARCSV